MAFTTVASVRNASTTLRPPQGHCSTSSRKTRRRSSLQGMRVCRPELGRSAAVLAGDSPGGGWTGAGWQAAAPDSGGRGTISARQAELGPKTPW